jgi:hypothetical protein
VLSTLFDMLRVVGRAAGGALPSWLVAALLLFLVDAPLPLVALIEVFLDVEGMAVTFLVMLLVTALISVSLLIVVVFISWLASVVARSSRVGSGLVTFCFLGTVFLGFCAVLRAALVTAAALRLTTPDEVSSGAAILLVTRRSFNAPFLVVTMLGWFNEWSSWA